MFPFLIGRIRTKGWKEPLIHAVALFPFLIGRIRTEEQEEELGEVEKGFHSS